MSNAISSQMEFKNFKVFNYTYAGRPLVIETGKMAGLANGSVLIRYGETALLCCATASAKPRDGIAAACGKADEYLGKKRGVRTRRAYGTESVWLTRKLTYHNVVSHVIKMLEKVSQHKGDDEADHL